VPSESESESVPVPSESVPSESVPVVPVVLVVLVEVVEVVAVVASESESEPVPSTMMQPVERAKRAAREREIRFLDMLRFSLVRSGWIGLSDGVREAAVAERRLATAEDSPSESGES
jgi:hypothetical protein